MQRTRIKICGVTRPQDAVEAVAAGADAIGMVFHPPAARNVSLERAQEILNALPAFVTPVGLFVDRPVDEIRETAARLGLRTIQLHGHETAQTVESLRPLSVIKAIRVTRATLATDMALWRQAIQDRGLGNLKAFVLDAAAGGQSGGLGVENDWEAIASAQAGGVFSGLPPIIAAGGLTPHNVATVIELLRPWAVDVSSGVEESKGCKSAQKMSAFIHAVKDADARAL